jgi:succinoglycan biosynthesis transport protein ExoP
MLYSNPERTYMHGLSGGPNSFPSSSLTSSTPEDVLSLSHYLSTLRRHWWKIMLAVALCTIAALLASYVITPIYQATARVTIDEIIPSVVISGDAAHGAAGDIDQTINTEMQLIRSDAVLRPVAEQFHLLKSDDGGSAQGMAAPVVLSGLTVEHIPNSRLIDITYRSTDRLLASQVANAVAHSYIVRNQDARIAASVELSSVMEKQIAQLKKSMDDSARTLVEEQRKLGVINPAQKTSILTSRLLQLNSQYTDAENERIRKETEFAAIKSGSNAALEASPQAAALNALDERVRAAQEKMAQVQTVYGPGYTEYKRAANNLAEVTRQDQELRAGISKRIDVEYREALHREGMLRATLAAAKDESDKLNATSFQYEQLEREVQSKTALYNDLNRKIEEESINAGFQSGSIRVADEARPALRPIFPRKSVFVLLGFLVSLLASAAAILLAELSDKSVRDTATAAYIAGLPILGSLPDVRRFPTRLLMPQYPGETSRGKNVQTVPHDFYRECVASSLCTVLNSRRNGRVRSILITSPGPAEGKSSFAAHFAAAYAAQGMKTLLVDADLRNPSQHKYLSVSKDGGLTGMIEGNLRFNEARQHVPGQDHLDVVVAGDTARPPLTGVGRQVLQLIEEAGEEYSLIVIDSPPMLSFAEPIQIASGTDGVLLIGRAGQTSRESLLRSLATLHSVGANVVGMLLNRVQLNVHDDYLRYRAYKRYSHRRITSTPREIDAQA